MPSDEKIVKKKRGRKPKSEVEAANKLSDASMSADVNLNLPQIINIKKQMASSNDKAEDECNFEESFCEYDPNMLVPHAYNKEDKFLATPSHFEISDKVDSAKKKTEQQNAWPTKTNKYCMWCCHPFTNTPIGIPIKFTKNTFYCTGNFCSFECAVAHNYECTDLNVNVWERFNLLNLMAIKNGAPNPVVCAKPKACLEIFGGNEDIETFRKNNTNIVYYTHAYPMISALDQVEELGDSFSTSNTESFTIQKDHRSKQTTIQQFY
tara:strand:- start:625 stop:1419 length:795 start_codon:yes stop_codon:yes gene_type:complete